MHTRRCAVQENDLRDTTCGYVRCLVRLAVRERESKRHGKARTGKRGTNALQSGGHHGPGAWGDGGGPGVPE